MGPAIQGAYMRISRLPWTALSLACLVPLLSAAPQGSAAMRLTKPAQEKTAKPQMNPAEKEFKRLTDEVRKARADYYKQQAAAARKAREEGKMIPAMNMRVDLSQFTDQFRAAAKKFAGTDDAIQFLVFTLNISSDKAVLREVTDTLIQDHLGSSKMAEFVALTLGRVARGLGEDNTTRLLDACAKSDSRLLEGAVHFYRGSQALANRKIGDADKKAAYDEMRKVLELAPKASFARRAEGILYEADHLQVGMKSPDIEGKDTDGVAFKLSDYEGKVILLDFWGDW